jgi:hypothetical protein
LLTIIIAIAMLVGGSALAGCGSSTAADSTADSSTTTGKEPPAVDPAYKSILQGLVNAAHSGSNYNALRRAKQLNRVDKAVVESFCNFAWQIGVNHEAYKLADHAYIPPRLEDSAEFTLGEEYASAIAAATDELGAIVDLTALDADLVGRYKQACEH